jgi:cold shock CspA family protein
MEDARGEFKAHGTVWRWNDKRATGMIETIAGEHVWFGLDSLGDRNFGDVTVGDPVEVEYETAEQDSHNLRATKITWL